MSAPAFATPNPAPQETEHVDLLQEQITANDLSLMTAVALGHEWTAIRPQRTPTNENIRIARNN
jgi:hypothetical protein